MERCNLDRKRGLVEYRQFKSTICSVWRTPAYLIWKWRDLRWTTQYVDVIKLMRLLIVSLWNVTLLLQSSDIMIHADKCSTDSSINHQSREALESNGKTLPFTAELRIFGANTWSKQFLLSMLTFSHHNIVIVASSSKSSTLAAAVMGIETTNPHRAIT